MKKMNFLLIVLFALLTHVNTVTAQAQLPPTLSSYGIGHMFEWPNPTTGIVLVVTGPSFSQTVVDSGYVGYRVYRNTVPEKPDQPVGEIELNGRWGPHVFYDMGLEYNALYFYWITMYYNYSGFVEGLPSRTRGIFTELPTPEVRGRIEGNQTIWTWPSCGGNAFYVNDAAGHHIDTIVRPVRLDSVTYAGVDILQWPIDLTDVTYVTSADVMIKVWVQRYGGVRNTIVGALSDTSETPVITGIINNSGALPNEYQLYQNHPNPFNPSTTIEFSVPYDGNVKVTVFNMQGQEVAVLTNRFYLAGGHSTTWNATSFPSGTYICRIDAGEFSATKKMILMK